MQVGASSHWLQRSSKIARIGGPLLVSSPLFVSHRSKEVALLSDVLVDYAGRLVTKNISSAYADLVIERGSMRPGTYDGHHSARRDAGYMDRSVVGMSDPAPHRQTRVAPLGRPRANLGRYRLPAPRSVSA